MFLKQVGTILELQHIAASCSQIENKFYSTMTSDIACDLSHLGLISVCGPDKNDFLQGQLTCDVRRLAVDHSLIGAYCNYKGRVLACFRLFQCKENYYMELPRPLVQPTLNRLRKYILRAKVKLEDASDIFARIGVISRTQNIHLILGKGITSGIANMPGNGVRHTDNLTLIRLPGSIPRFELHYPSKELHHILGSLEEANITLVSAELWRLLDILAGMPIVYPQTTEAFLPQMLNLHLLDGISFHKGCYVGQETIARTQYLGKIKQRMLLAQVDSSTPPYPGDLLFSSYKAAFINSESVVQSVGRLVDVTRHPDGGYAVLGVVLKHAAENAILQLGRPGGSILHLAPLPYSLE
jgi:tRNA-modifying protein YgfZ